MDSHEKMPQVGTSGQRLRIIGLGELPLLLIRAKRGAACQCVPFAPFITRCGTAVSDGPRIVHIDPSSGCPEVSQIVGQVTVRRVTFAIRTGLNGWT